MKQFLIFALVVLATPTWSLSCLRPDIVSTFEQARDAKEGFWIVRGLIDPHGDIAVPEPLPDGRYKDGASAMTAATVKGIGLRPNGTYGAFQKEITLSLTCLAHWCGSLGVDQEVFMAIEVKDSGPELLVDPCSSRIVPFTDDGEKRLLRCVRDGVCEREY